MPLTFEERLDSLENKSEAVDNKLDSMSQKLDSMSQQLGGMSQKLDDMNHQLGLILQLVNQSEQRVAHAHRDRCITAVDIYSRLGYVLQRRWFPSLPRPVRRKLKAGPSTNLSRAVSCWWVLQNQLDPTSYPLPQGLQFCANERLLSISDDADWSEQLMSAHGRETWLGGAVRQAWEHITAVDRELMLICWAGGRRNYYVGGIAGSAFDVIDRELIGRRVY